MKLRSKQIVAIVTGLVIGLSSMSVMAKPKKAKRSQAQAQSSPCAKFYQGKRIEFQPAGYMYFGNWFSAYVMGTGGGKVTFKITDGVPDIIGEVIEADCTSDQIR